MVEKKERWRLYSVPRTAVWYGVESVSIYPVDLSVTWPRYLPTSRLWSGLPLTFLTTFAAWADLWCLCQIKEDFFNTLLRTSSLKERSAICIIIATASLACARKANASCVSEASRPFLLVHHLPWCPLRCSCPTKQNDSVSE